MAKQTWVGSDRVKPVLLEKIPSNTDEFYAHKIATTGEHGISGTIVGTTEVQTLTNKVISATNNTLSGLRHGEEVDDLTEGVHGITGQVVGTTDTQTLTNKTLVDVDIQGVVGLSGDLVTTSATQTLTNKTILIVEPILPEEPATKNYVDQMAFNAVLPDMPGHEDTFLHTDGTTAQWVKTPKTAVYSFTNLI